MTEKPTTEADARPLWKIEKFAVEGSPSDPRVTLILSAARPHSNDGGPDRRAEVTYPLRQAIARRLHEHPGWQRLGELLKEQQQTDRRRNEASRRHRLAQIERERAELEAAPGLAARLVDLDARLVQAQEGLTRAEAEYAAICPLVAKARAELESAVPALVDSLSGGLVEAFKARATEAESAARTAVQEQLVPILGAVVARLVTRRDAASGPALKDTLDMARRSALDIAITAEWTEQPDADPHRAAQAREYAGLPPLPEPDPEPDTSEGGPEENGSPEGVVTRGATPADVAAFLAERFRQEAGQTAPTGAVYSAWSEWCRPRNLEVGTEQGLGRLLREVVPGLSTRQVREGDSRSRVYVGLALVEQPTEAVPA